MNAKHFIHQFHCPSLKTDHEHRNAQAFTLIELLVVISIVALLISILLPALGSARDAARAALCLSNQRQLTIGWTTHAVDHNGKAMYSESANSEVNSLTGSNERQWVFEMDDYAPVISENGLLACPQADALSGRTESNDLYGDFANNWWIGGSSLTHFPQGHPGVNGGYGYNNYWEYDAANGGASENWDFLADEGFKTIDSAAMPSETPVFADSSRPDIAWPENDIDSIGFPHYLTWPAALRIEDGLLRDTWRLTMSRHGQIGSTNTASSGVNMSMADGSTRFLPVQDLGRVQWSRTFEQHPPP